MDWHANLAGVIALSILPACADGAGFDGYSPQVVETSGKSSADLQTCMLARLARLGSPVVKSDEHRVVFDFAKGSPPVTVVINELSRDTRSIEVWKTGPRDEQLRRDTLGCL